MSIHQRNKNSVLYFDADCGLCTVTIRALSSIDFFHRVTWTAYQTLDEPPHGITWDDLARSAYLMSSSGHLYEGFYAFRKLTLMLLPLLPIAPILWMPGISHVGVRVYRWIARNRHRISGCPTPTPEPELASLPRNQSFQDGTGKTYIR